MEEKATKWLSKNETIRKKISWTGGNKSKEEKVNEYTNTPFIRPCTTSKQKCIVNYYK